MTRILSLLVLACLISVSLCRHLEDTLSDARTILNQAASNSPSAVGDTDGVRAGGDTSETGRLTDSMVITNPADLDSTGNPIEPNTNSQKVSEPVQTIPDVHNKEIPTSSDIIDKHPSPSSTHSDTRLTDTDGMSTYSASDRSPHIEGTIEENKNQVTQPAPETSLVVKDTSSQPTNNDVGHADQTLQEAQASGMPEEHKDSVSTVNNMHSTKVDAEVKDYEKKHAQLETASSRLRSTDSVTGGDMKQTTNVDTDLPYVKLDNVNDANVDNAPIIRPEMTHMDNLLDEVEKIDMPPTVIPTNPANTSSIVWIGNGPNVTQTETNGDTNTNAMNEIKAAGPSPDKVVSDQGKKTINNIPSPENIQKSENPKSTVVNTDVAKQVENIPVTIDTPVGDSAMEITTTTVTPTSATPATEPKPAAKNMDTASNINPSVSTDTEGNVVVDAGVDNIAPAVPMDVTDNTGNRDPEDVAPLDIFVDDITYQRFPTAMPLALFKEKIAGQTFKKLYILESSDKKLFQNVRQLEVTYQLEGEELYAEFLFRFIYSRQCTRIEKFKLGTLAKDSETATFEKGVENAKTERLVFFTQRPDDYIYLMSCTDEKNSPYACRETYYVTLDSKRDPPNQFPWLDAARELQNEMDLSFEDPRFIFNFVMMPCARG